MALNLALAQIATGKWAEARTTLDRHADTVPTADRGLALALAGDPAAAVTLLTAATRTAAADAKTRQNLALAMALSGEWQQARTLIGLDLAPAEADARIVQWAALARPAGASDQVAALLGVTPAADPGQPVALALAGAGAGGGREGRAGRRVHARPARARGRRCGRPGGDRTGAGRAGAGRAGSSHPGAGQPAAGSRSPPHPARCRSSRSRCPKRSPISRPSRSRRDC
ncbi:hypothetical protein AB5I41_16950 [Sphingomonas sp. MMS24-JH45]